jgi:hypothetical protein
MTLRPHGTKNLHNRKDFSAVVFYVFFSIAMGLSLCCPAMSIAQGVEPLFGGTDQSNRSGKYHTSLSGKPCLSVASTSKSQKINPDIYDHLISITNSCPMRIKVRVCYYRSEHCVLMEVPSYERREEVLGVFPRLKDFRYEYKELF